MTSTWRKSSRSQGDGGNCVEARTDKAGFQVRDSKLGESSPIFGLATEDFKAVLRAARR
ncbi:MAG TPA: DUF397 domain-containing protein [Jiangellaceae bacterium]|nr:DUF397 domain-containing protein [Jiangellaceae bacterium]